MVTFPTEESIIQPRESWPNVMFRQKGKVLHLPKLVSPSLNASREYQGAPKSGPFLRHKCYVIKCIRLANSDCNSHCKLLSSIVVVVIYTVNDDGECNLHCTQLPLVHNLSCYQISYFITDHWSQRLWTPNFKFWISNSVVHRFPHLASLECLQRGAAHVKISLEAVFLSPKTSLHSLLNLTLVSL